MQQVNQSVSVKFSFLCTLPILGALVAPGSELKHGKPHKKPEEQRLCLTALSRELQVRPKLEGDEEASRWQNSSQAHGTGRYTGCFHLAFQAKNFQRSIRFECLTPIEFAKFWATYSLRLFQKSHP